MKDLFFELALSRSDISTIIDGLLNLKFQLYMEEIELKGEGKPHSQIKRRYELVQALIDHLDSYL